MTEQHTDREIKQAVVDRYGQRARSALESVGADAASADACCGPAADTAESGAPQTLQFVELDASDASGEACGPDGCAIDVTDATAASSSFGAALYDAEEIGDVPEAAQLAAAGCGNPVAIAEMKRGEAVLDLGSGGGIDCFLAAKQVGDEGEVWGLDMTPDMIQLARHNAEQVEATNVRFRLGEIEDMPFEDGHFDVVISNCVINLSTDKPRVFSEAFRVLAPGGRLKVSDIVLTGQAVNDEHRKLDDWAACVAGALPVDEYLGGIREAGFVDVTAEYEDSENGVVSAYVSARRPA
ncbi:MAG: arsenite methyltransferase [Dehalococcoidia bacterium]